MARWPRAGSLLRGLWDTSSATPPGVARDDAPVDPELADTDAAEARARRDALRPDPAKIGGVGDAPFAALPDPATLFAARAERFDALAADHPLGDYLRFLAALTRVQDSMRAALPPLPPPDEAALALRLQHAMPPLSPQDLDGDAAFAATLDALLRGVAALDAALVPDAAREAAARLGGRPAAERTALAAAVSAGATPVDHLAEAVFAAAALQVHLARRAATLDVGALHAVADGVCPACGSAPVASLVVGWTRASKARYCACPLCATQWNHVRVKCTACGATDAVLYHNVPEVSPDVAVETCGTCRSYIKHMQQHAEPRLDPVADDIASYALDLLIREDGFRRGGLNPLFVQG